MTTDQPGQLLFAGFDGTTLPDDLAALIGAGRIGGVVLFARNIVDPAQTSELVASIHACAPSGNPVTVSIDQEGGRVQRLRAPWTEWPPMRALGARPSADDTSAFARALARELADLRIDVDFAPVVDVDTRTDNPVIGDRAFSGDPDRVGVHAAAFIEALQDAGVGACAKHFPGHGDTDEDSHLALPRVSHDLQRLREVELPPFRAAIEAGVASVMTAHISLPALDREHPATLSPIAIRLLRDELGYDGLVFSDDLEMKAVADHYEPEPLLLGALQAGVDAVLVCRDLDLRDRVLAALEGAPSALVETGLERMAAFKACYAGGRHAQGGAPPYPEHIALATRLSGSDPSGATS
jgi:beta-N-acetylhexosaminidase